MARKARPHPKPVRRKTFIRAWRKHRGLTLIQFSDRLATELEIDLDHSQVSRIERGESPYSQDNLEAFAAILRCEPADLLMRDPTQPEAIHSILDGLDPPKRRIALDMLKALRGTGTDG